MASFWLIVWLSLASGPAVESAQAASPSPATARGAFFALSVTDLGATAEWYTKTLGLEVVMSSPAQGTIPAVTILEGHGLIVELIQNANSSATPAPSAGSQGPPRLFKAGVIVEDFDGTVALLKSRGVEFVAGPFPPRPGKRANLLIKDNAGNLIQFFGPAR